MKRSSPINTKVCPEQADTATTTPPSQDEKYLTGAGASKKWGWPIAKNFGTNEVLMLMGGSKATHYNRLNPKSPYYDPAYPKPIKNGRLSIYLSSEVTAYLENRVSIRDSDP